MKHLKDCINAAAEAKANLHVFNAVVGLLESGSITEAGTARSTAAKIIKLCKAEMQGQLWAMDAAIEAAHGIKGDA